MTYQTEIPLVTTPLEYGITFISGGVLVYRWYEVEFDDGEYEVKCEPHVFLTVETALAFIQSMCSSDEKKITATLDNEGIVLEGTER